jgi:hypothetical protein
VTKIRPARSSPSVLFAVRILPWLAILGACVGVSIGCGSSNASLRLVNALPGTPNVDLEVDSKVLTSNLSYSAATAYLTVHPGARHIQVNIAGTATTLLDSNASLNAGNDYTYVALGASGSRSALVLTDTNTPPTSGNASMRIIQAAVGLGGVDVYVTTPTTDISAATPNVANLAFGSASAYLSLGAGSYRMQVTTAGTKDVVIDAGTFNLSGGQIRTAVALAPGGGNSAFSAVLLPDLN